jgi:hypothetical protein
MTHPTAHPVTHTRYGYVPATASTDWTTPMTTHGYTAHPLEPNSSTESLMIDGRTVQSPSRYPTWRRVRDADRPGVSAVPGRIDRIVFLVCVGGSPLLRRASPCCSAGSRGGHTGSTCVSTYRGCSGAHLGARDAHLQVDHAERFEDAHLPFVVVAHAHAEGEQLRRLQLARLAALKQPA